MLKENMNNKTFRKFNNFLKKIIAISIIVTNLSLIIPIVCFANDSESDNDEKFPSLVSVAADSIISKFVNTDLNGGGSSASAGGIITNYEETGDGWDSVAEVKYPNGVTRKFRRYKQWSGSYAQEKYWEKEETIAESACGPTAISIILSGYGIDASPLDVVNAFFSMEYYYTSTERIKNVLEKKYNITSEWITATSDNIQKIRDNFKNGRPIIAGVYNHFITYLGEDSSGDLILADPGYVDRTYGKTLEEYVKNQPGYDVLLITSDGNASTNSSVNTNNTKNATNNSNTTKTTNTSNTTNTKKTSKIISKEPEKCDPYNGGYEAIFTSSTTGRQFKEYRQNLDGWNERYNISGVGCSWTSECGLVSCMIVGSGYSEEANFENATNILVNELNGGTTHSVFFNRWIPGQATDYCGYYSENEMIENLKKGCVGILRLGTTSSWGQHYVTVLDYDSSNGKVYISNPWMDGFPVGWSDPSELTGQMGVLSVDDMIFFSNDGSIVNYSGSGSSRSSKKSNVDMSKNIVLADENDKSKGYKINIDLDKEIDEMVQKLQKLDFNMSKYLNGSNNQEKLKNIVKACIVTQYPDLRSAKEIANPKSEKDADGVHGCVKFKRYVDQQTEDYISKANLSNPMDSEKDGGGMYLEYIPLNELKQMISDGDLKALNYFSMDSSNNIIVAGWETMDVSINIQQVIKGDEGDCPTSVYGEVPYEPKSNSYQKLTTKSINYLDQISNYSLPFSMFWSLLVYGHDEKFINDFANLVISTNIVIGCFDAVTTTQTKYTHEDTKMGEAKIDLYNINTNNIAQTGGRIANDNGVVEYHFVITEIDTHRVDKPTLKLKYADTWTAVYNKDYIIETKDSSEKSDKVELDEIIKETHFYQKNERNNGTTGYSKSGKPQDPKLAEIVDNKIDSFFEKNISKFEEETKQKNKDSEDRYQNLMNYIQNNNVVAVNATDKKEDIEKFLNIKEVQNQIINLVIKMANDDNIDSVFSFNVNQQKEENTNSEGVIEGASDEFKIMKKYASTVNNDPSQLLNSICTLVKKLVRQHVIEKGGTNSELYKLLTKNGANTKLNYTVTGFFSSQIEVVLKDTNITEESEKNTSEESIKEVSKDGNLRWKVDKNAKENSFVKILAHSKSAKGNLRVVGAWFFDSLEDTAAIADYEDLLKFLFQKALGADYGINDTDAEKLLNLFDPEKFQNLNSSNSNLLSGEMLLGKVSAECIEFINGSEGGDEYIHGDQYEIFSIGDGTLNLPRGIVVCEIGGASWYPDLIPNPQLGQTVSKDIYDKVFERVYANFINKVDAALAKYGVKVTQNQYDAFISMCYNLGHVDVFVEAYKEGGNEGLWAELKQYTNPPEYKLGLMRRRSEEYELFIKGDYKEDPIYNGWEVKYY